MKRSSLVFAFLLPIMGCQSPGLVPSISEETVQRDIRKELAQFSELSGKSDLEGVVARFDEDADILLVGSDAGEVFKGRAAIREWLGRLYKSSGFRWQMDRIEISHHGNTAWAFVEGNAIVTNRQTGAPRFTAPYRFSAIRPTRGDVEVEAVSWFGARKGVIRTPVVPKSI